MNLGLQNAQKFYLGNQEVSKIILQNVVIAPQAFPTAPEAGSTITGFGVDTDPAGISIIDWGDNSTSVVSTNASVNKTY